MEHKQRKMTHEERLREQVQTLLKSILTPDQEQDQEQED